MKKKEKKEEEHVIKKSKKLHKEKFLEKNKVISLWLGQFSEFDWEREKRVDESIANKV